VKTFYVNLKSLYDKHIYDPYHVWNVDKNRVQNKMEKEGYLLKLELGWCIVLFETKENG